MRIAYFTMVPSGEIVDNNIQQNVELGLSWEKALRVTDVNCLPLESSFAKKI